MTTIDGDCPYSNPVFYQYHRLSPRGEAYFVHHFGNHNVVVVLFVVVLVGVVLVGVVYVVVAEVELIPHSLPVSLP